MASMIAELSAIIPHRGCTSMGDPRNAAHCSKSRFATNHNTIAVRAICVATQALRRRTGDGGAIDVGVASGNRFRGEGGQRVETSGGAERRASIASTER